MFKFRTVELHVKTISSGKREGILRRKEWQKDNSMVWRVGKPEYRSNGGEGDCDDGKGKRIAG